MATRTQSKEKKGKPSWKPASALKASPIEGFRTRWTHKDPINIQRKEAEGWVMATEVNGLKSEHEHPEDIESGKPVTSVTEYRELVLMALPEEDGQARDEYFTEQTEKQTAGLKKNLQSEVSKGGKAAVHGKITIE